MSISLRRLGLRRHNRTPPRTPKVIPPQQRGPTARRPPNANDAARPASFIPSIRPHRQSLTPTTRRPVNALPRTTLLLPGPRDRPTRAAAACLVGVPDMLAGASRCGARSGHCVDLFHRPPSFYVQATAALNGFGPSVDGRRRHMREVVAMSVTAKGRRGGPGIFAIRDISTLVTETHEHGHELKRSVGGTQLLAMGVGAIIGTGIFVVIGEGAGIAGPAVILAFVLAAVACTFSALSYAELASSIPVSGSAYTYSYATLGEIVAWIIGWDLILEYGVSVAAVAVGWGGNVNVFLDAAFNYQLPDAISKSPEDGGVFNLPAVFIEIGRAH